MWLERKKREGEKQEGVQGGRKSLRSQRAFKGLGFYSQGNKESLEGCEPLNDTLK